jgi:adenine C2-methylase RlmN of 23S rRNA A2503 and tRNA A37
MASLRIGHNAYLRAQLIEWLNDSFNTRIEPEDDLRVIDQKLGRREVIEYIENMDDEETEDGNLRWPSSKTT